MILLENKLAIFNKIVYVKKEEISAKKIKEARKRAGEKLEKKKEELNKKSDEIVARRSSLAKKYGFEKLSKEEEKRRIYKLKKHDELLFEILKDLTKECEKFTKCSKYEDFLKKSLTEALSDLKENSFEIYLCDEDKKYFDELLKIAKEMGKDLILKEMEKKNIGGFILKDSNGLYNIDSSLRNRIYDKKYEIGKILHYELAGVKDE